MSKRTDLYPTLSRISPVICFYITLFNCIIFPSYNSFYLFVSYNIILGSNWFIKHLIFKPIYEFINKTSLPIIGIGKRPLNAISCGFTLNNELSTSYGMPSGHSQGIWALCTYIILKIITNWYNIHKDKEITIFEYIRIIVVSLLILFIAIYVSYTRIYIEGCHTIQQVSIGGFIGTICGFLVYYYENNIVNFISKIY